MVIDFGLLLQYQSRPIQAINDISLKFLYADI